MEPALPGPPNIPAAAEPDRQCSLCPRLRDYILDNRSRHPDWHNGPVANWYPPEGPVSVRLLIVGLAPGLRGANRTGRPFTGDFSGELLYSTLVRNGLAAGVFDNRPDDGLQLCCTAITNSVRCVPPQNKPVGAEINTCRRFLDATLNALPKLAAIVTLGKVAHDSTVRTMGGRIAAHPFGHGAQSDIGAMRLFSSYHCSRYNINTGRLTETMFNDVFSAVAAHLKPA